MKRRVERSVPIRTQDEVRYGTAYHETNAMRCCERKVKHGMKLSVPPQTLDETQRGTTHCERNAVPCRKRKLKREGYNIFCWISFP